MNKIVSVIKLILSIACRVTGLVFAFVALDFWKKHDMSTAAVGMVLAVVVFFLPDLIRRRLENGN